MHRNEILNLLQTHFSSSIFEDEKQMVSQTIDFVKANQNCFSNNNLPGHITGSAFIYHKKNNVALFTHHKKLKKWLQLGGHSDGNCNIYQTVLREAKEESGIDNFTYYSKNIFDVDVHQIPENKKMPKHFHFDIRFLLLTNSLNFKISNESLALKWIALNEIKNHNNDRSIIRMVEKIKNLF